MGLTSEQVKHPQKGTCSLMKYGTCGGKKREYSLRTCSMLWSVLEPRLSKSPKLPRLLKLMLRAMPRSPLPAVLRGLDIAIGAIPKESAHEGAHIFCSVNITKFSNFTSIFLRCVLCKSWEARRVRKRLCITTSRAMNLAPGQSI